MIKLGDIKMFKLKNGDIIPKQGIGNFMLGMTFDEIKSMVDDFCIEEHRNVFIVVCDNIQFWIKNETKKCKQILVTGDFSGKFNDIIGIGTTLDDIEKLGYEWYDDLDAYFIKGIDGICFELADTDEEVWDELTAPIAHISVFSD